MRTGVFQPALAAVWGALFAVAFSGVFLADQVWLLSGWLRALVFLALALVGAWIWIHSLKWLQGWQSGISRRNLAIGLALCLLAGIFLVVVFPLRGPFTPQAHTVQITATGERNERSQGSGIWLQSVASPGVSQPGDLRSICTGDWRYEEGSWVSGPGQDARLVCRVHAIDRMSLRFRVDERSGVVAIAVDQMPKFKQDLYAETSGAKDVDAPFAASRLQKLVSAGITLCVGLWAGWILFAVSLFLVQRPAGKSGSSKNLPWYAFAVPLIGVWLLYLIAFWPGFMNPDAQDQWNRMIAGRINNWHPAIHTLTFWLITRIWFSPAAVSLAQVLILALLCGAILAYTRRRGAPFWIGVAILAMLCLPPYGLAVISLWKDVPYSIALLGLTFCLLLIVETGGAWIVRPPAWIGLGAIGALAALYRHNGAPGAFASLGLLVLAYPKYRRQMAAALLVAVLLFLAILGPLYRSVGVRKGSTNPGVQLAFAHLIARHTQARTPLLAEERALLAAIRDDEGIWPYDCYSNNPLAFDGRMDQARLQRSTFVLAKTALRLTMRSPKVTLQHLACNGAFVFRILPPMAGKRYMPYEASPLNLSPNPRLDRQHSEISSRWPELRDAIFALTERLYFSNWNGFFWRSPFWMYLLVFAAVIAAIRTKRRAYLLVIVPALLSTLPLAFISFIQAFRLVMPLMLVSLMLSGYLLTRDPG